MSETAGPEPAAPAPPNPNRRAYVHNAITEALGKVDEWVPLSVRSAATRAALAEVDAWRTAGDEPAPQPEPADGDLRDRIRRAICEASGFEFEADGIEPDEYGEHADAVLAAILPEPRREAAEELAEDDHLLAAAELRRMADEGQQAGEGGALKRAHVALADQAGRDQAALARVRALHDSLEASTELTSPDDPITRGAAARRIAAALDGVTDQPAN